MSDRNLQNSPPPKPPADAATDNAPPPPPFGNESITAQETPGLPWERRQGFLWGFPATVWMLLRHPFQAYATQPASGVMEPLVFSAIMHLLRFSFVYITTFVWSWAYYMYLVIFAADTAITTPGHMLINLLKDLPVTSIKFCLNHTFMHACWALTIWVLSPLWVKDKPSWLGCYRGIAYADLSTLFLALPIIGISLQYAWLWYWAVYSFSKTSWLGKARTFTLFFASYIIMFGIVVAFDFCFGFWDSFTQGITDIYRSFFFPIILK